MPDDPNCKLFPDLDRGMEWCENQLLEASKYRRARFLPLSMQLKTFLTADSNQISALMNYLESIPMEAGDHLFHQGDAPDALYFVESGEISTTMDLENGKNRRAQTLGAGTIIGEVEFYTQVPYTLSAIAEKPSTLYRLHIQNLQRMREEHSSGSFVYREWVYLGSSSPADANRSSQEADWQDPPPSLFASGTAPQNGV